MKKIKMVSAPTSISADEALRQSKANLKKRIELEDEQTAQSMASVYAKIRRAIDDCEVEIRFPYCLSNAQRDLLTRQGYTIEEIKEEGINILVISFRTPTF